MNLYKNERLFYIKKDWPEQRILDIENLIHIYKNRFFETVALNEFSLQVNRGEFIAIMGPSGSGKTTLIKILAGLLSPTAGSIYVKLENPKNQSEKAGQSDKITVIDLSTMDLEELRLFRLNYIGYISQHFDLFEELTALENVLLPTLIKTVENKRLSKRPENYEDLGIISALIENYGNINDISEEELKKEAEQILKYIGIYDRRYHSIKQMSGGERQRVAIAAAVFKNPGIILADEPTGELDFENAKNIFALFKKVSKERKIPIICVTHDFLVKNYADRIIYILDGKNSQIPDYLM